MIGLHTAGIVPEMLERVAPITSWIGFDVKNDFDDYEMITGVPGSGKLALESLKLLLKMGANFEVRITMYQTLEKQVIADLLKKLASMGVKTLALQKCRDENEMVVDHPIFSDKILLEDVSKLFERFLVR